MFHCSLQELTTPLSQKSISVTLAPSNDLLPDQWYYFPSPHSTLDMTCFTSDLDPVSSVLFRHVPAVWGLWSVLRRVGDDDWRHWWRHDVSASASSSHLERFRYQHVDVNVYIHIQFTCHLFTCTSNSCLLVRSLPSFFGSDASYKRCACFSDLAGPVVVQSELQSISHQLQDAQNSLAMATQLRNDVMGSEEEFAEVLVLRVYRILIFVHVIVCNKYYQHLYWRRLQTWLCWLLTVDDFCSKS